MGIIFCYKCSHKVRQNSYNKPKTFSSPARILIGLAIGSAFTPEILKYIPEYTFSLLLVIPFTILVIFFGTFYYYKILKYDLKLLI